MDHYELFYDFHDFYQLQIVQFIVTCLYGHKLNTKRLHKLCEITHTHIHVMLFNGLSLLILNKIVYVCVYLQNIELKVEVESMKRDLAEKQELLVSAS